MGNTCHAQSGVMGVKEAEKPEKFIAGDKTLSVSYRVQWQPSQNPREASLHERYEFGVISSLVGKC